MVRFPMQEMLSPKEIISHYKFCVMRQESYPANQLPPAEVEAETIIMENCVKSMHNFLATQNLEQRLDMLVDQWHQVSKPEQKAKIEKWIDDIQNQFVQSFYAGII